MSLNEKKAALQKVFDRYNWSIRSTEAGGDCRVHVYTQGNTQVGSILLSGSGGYYPQPVIVNEQIRGLFYTLVDEALDG